MTRRSHCLLILKPDALERALTERILARFVDEGFSIEIVGYRRIDHDLITAHYRGAIERVGKELEVRVVRSYVGRHMVPLVLGHAEADAIARARALIGATDPSKAERGTIRGDFGVDSIAAAVAENRSCDNLVHCCDSPESFLHETTLWFEPETAARFL